MLPSEAASFIFSDLQGSSISTGLGRVVGTVFGGEKSTAFILVEHVGTIFRTERGEIFRDVLLLGFYF